MKGLTRFRLGAALAKYDALRGQARPESDRTITLLRAREAQLQKDVRTAKTLLATVRIDANTFSGLQESIGAGVVWLALGEPRVAAEIADAGLAAIERSPERQRLTGMRDKLQKLKR